MSGRIRVMALTAIGTGLVVIACSKSKKQESTASTAETASAAPAAASAPAVAKVDPATAAKTYFTQKCVVCHGANGKGDGPGAANLNPKPQNYTDAKWQDKVKDDELKKAIVQGGAAVGRSPIMPAHPDLKKKPEVVDALVKLIRSFKGK